MAGWVLGTYWTKWRSRAMGEAEGDPGCHSSHEQGLVGVGSGARLVGTFLPCLSFILLLSDKTCRLSVRWSSLLSTLNKFSRRHKSIFGCMGFFFRDSTSSLSAKGLRMSLPKLPRLILGIGEEFVKNIVFCVTEHCNTESIWYFKSTKFHYLYAQYSI